jgi:hypothetical protein
MAHDNHLQPYYQQLRCDFPIDYDELILTAKNLKTLSDEDKRTIISSLRKADDDSFSASDSSDNKNLMDQMMEKISQIDYPPGGQDRAVLKKRWWTPEEDEKLRQLV